MRSRVLKSLLIAVVALIALALAGAFILDRSQQPPRHRVFVGGRVLTMNPQNAIAEAISLRSDRIEAVGSDEEIEALIEDGTVVVDLAGKTLMPGIIDAHGHYPGSGLATVAADLTSPPVGEVTQIDQLIARLRERAEQTDSGRWVLGFGYDDTLVREKRHPSAADLDRASSEHPIYIWHVSGHMGVGNSLALAELGITRDTPDPEGGVIRKDPVSGEPTGLLEETAQQAALAHAMNFSVLDFLGMVRDASAEYAEVGVTTAQVGAAAVEMVQGLWLASKLGLIPFRLVVFPLYDEMAPKILDGSFDPARYESEMLEIGAVKIIADGSIQGYTGYLTEPYHVPFHGDANYRGYPTLKREDLVEEVAKLHGAGLQLAIHGNGDASIDDIIHAFREAQRRHPRDDARLIVIHAQMTREDQLDAMKELGITPSFFSAHTYYWGDRHWEIFMGPERARRMSPTRSALDKGVRFSVHLDTPVVPMQPMLLVWSTVNRISSGGRVIGEEQRISPMQALRAITIDAAWQVFREQDIGSLEPGKLADLIVLDADPLARPEAIREIEVLETVVGGRTIYRKEP